jgi:hypothetical protein
MPKRGRLGKDEKAYIAINAPKKSAVEIAQVLDRTVETVTEFIRLNVKLPATTPVEVEDAEKVTIRQELRNSEAWKNLKMEFLTEELKYFEEGYVKLMAQFRGDVWASEETQIFQAIKFEILMSRNLQERKRALQDIARLQKMQESFLDQFGGDPNAMTDDQKAFAMQLESQLSISRGAEQSKTTEYVKLQEKHADLMKGLKAVREQRVKDIEKSKVYYLDIVKELMERDVQDREARQRELLRLSGEMEHRKLGRPVKYEDGNEDSPILSCDTVDLGPEETSDEEEKG